MSKSHTTADQKTENSTAANSEPVEIKDDELEKTQGGADNLVKNKRVDFTITDITG